MLDYRSWLLNELKTISADLGLDDYSFEVYDEQDFAKKPSIGKKTITVVIKSLTASLIYSAKTQPIQLLVISEENSLTAANLIFGRLAELDNWKVVIEGTEYTKMSYTSPVVLNNFNLVNLGYRSVLYVTATLYILEGVADVSSLTIDGEEMKPINFSMAYSMSGDCQTFTNSVFAKTVMAVETLTISVVLPCVGGTFVDSLTKILNGTKSGNTAYQVAFTLNNVSFSFSMKVSNVQFATAPNSIPSLQVGFVL